MGQSTQNSISKVRLNWNLMLQNITHELKKSLVETITEKRFDFSQQPQFYLKMQVHSKPQCITPKSWFKLINSIIIIGSRRSKVNKH